VQGIPWKYTWKELKDLLAECGEVERADVMAAPDGRSKVGHGTTKPRQLLPGPLMHPMVHRYCVGMGLAVLEGGQHKFNTYQPSQGLAGPPACSLSPQTHSYLPCWLGLACSKAAADVCSLCTAAAALWRLTTSCELAGCDLVQT
jgi:hypothetical protein